MTSKQWQLVYGPVAWAALAFGTVHVLVMGVKGWDQQQKWPGNLPPITLTATMIPLSVMFLKVVQVSLSLLVRMCLSKPQADYETPLNELPSTFDNKIGDVSGTSTSPSDTGSFSRALVDVSKPDESDQVPGLTPSSVNRKHVKGSTSSGSLFGDTD